MYAKLFSKRKKKQRESPIKPLQTSLDKICTQARLGSENSTGTGSLAMTQQIQLQQGQLQLQRIELEKLKLEMQDRAAIRAERIKIKMCSNETWLQCLERWIKFIIVIDVFQIIWVSCSNCSGDSFPLIFCIHVCSGHIYWGLFSLQKIL